MLVTFGICFRQHFDTRYLVFYNPSPPKMFLSLDLLSEYRIQHGAIGPLYVTSSYSTWIFCRSFWLCNWLSLRRLVSWINHLSPACWSTFWKSIFKQQLGCRFDIMDSISSYFFFVFWHMQLHMSRYIISFFWLYCYFLNILYFFSSTPVLTSSIDVVFVLSILLGKIQRSPDIYSGMSILTDLTYRYGPESISIRI